LYQPLAQHADDAIRAIPRHRQFDGSGVGRDVANLAILLSHLPCDQPDRISRLAVQRRTKRILDFCASPVELLYDFWISYDVILTALARTPDGF